MHATRLGIAVLTGLLVALAAGDGAACDCSNCDECSGACDCCSCDFRAAAASEPTEDGDFSNALKCCTLSTPFSTYDDSDKCMVTFQTGFQRSCSESALATPQSSEESKSPRSASFAHSNLCLRIIAGRMTPTQVEELIARGFPTGTPAFWPRFGKTAFPWTDLQLRYRQPMPPIEHELAAIDGVAMRFADEGAAHPIHK